MLNNKLNNFYLSMLIERKIDGKNFVGWKRLDVREQDS